MSNDSFYEAYVSVIPTARGFEKSLTGQIAGPGAVAGGVAGGAAGKGFVAGFGKVLPLIGGVLATAGIGNVIGDAITDGADNQQLTQAVEQVYGDLGAAAIKAFADGGSKTVGQSMNEILAASSSLGTFGKFAGLSGDELVGFSKDIITLGADLSAFANTSPEEAVQALSAGLRGESEPLRKYSVFLDDATLKARALSMGIYDGNGPLTQQQRILAAYNEILAQTTDQQGQFARESDTLPGKQAAMASAWENISARMGIAFLPVAEDIVTLMETRLIPLLEDFADWLNEPETKQGIEDFGDSLSVVADALGYIGNTVADNFGAVKAVFDFLSGEISFETLTSRLMELPGLWGDVSNAVFDSGFAIGKWAFDTGAQIGNFARDVGRNITIAVNWFQSLPTKIGEAVAGAGTWLKDSGRALIQGFIDGIDSMFTPIRNAVTGVLDYVAGFFPNSPAKHGPLSGSGWTKLGQSGLAIAQQFARGIASDYSAVRGATQGMAAAAVAGPTIAPKMSIYAAPGMDEGALMRKAARYVEGLVD